jgi:hypothetical protein
MNDSHPHPDKQHVVLCYRKFLLSCKRKFGTARSQVHYLDIVRTYLRAKRERDCEASDAC